MESWGGRPLHFSAPPDHSATSFNLSHGVMPGFKIEAVILRPVEDVFAVLTDVGNLERWFPANLHEEWTTPPPHTVGSVRHAVITMMGRRSENDATVTEYEPPRRAALASEQQGIRWTAAFDFAPPGGETWVRLSFDASASGGTRVLLSPFLWWYRRAWERGLANLKRIMEAGEL